VRYRFGEHELDPDAYVLRHAGREIALQPKMLDLLRYLIEQRERVVSKEELLQALWPGEHVNDSAVAWTVSHVRTALGQGRGEKRPIETIHGRGYRFRADVTTETAGIVLAPEDNGVTQPSAPPARGRPYVGRVEVMRRLEALLAEAKQGRGRLCLVSGEAGIGKTRASEELMSRAEHRGMSIWLGRAVEDASAPVLWPFVQVLRKLAAERPALRAECEPLLQRLVTLEAPRDKGAERSGTGRFLLMDEVTRVLLRACAQTPALVVLDDLQWADSSTLDLLAFLTPELSRAHLLVMGTLRPSDDQRIQRIARRAEHIQLASLTEEDIGEYITAIVQPSENPEKLAAAVHRATSGNPLFVQETLRALIAEHGVRLFTRQPGEIAPPDVARNVLRSRLETLDATARTLLASASVLGEAFELPVLQAVTGAEPSALLDALEAAGHIGFAHAETPQRYRFAHALIRQVLYDGLPMPERVALHRKAALALEAVHTAESHSAEIAHHFYRSLALGDHARAAQACLRAASEADALYAYEDAARLYSWALEAQALDPSVSPRARASALLRAGTAQRHAGREGGGKRTLSRMFELAREHGFADLIVRGVRALRPTYAMASVPDPAAREALEAVLNMQPPAELESRVHALAQLACIPPYSLDMKKSEELSRKALELARAQAPESTLVPEAMRARLYSLSGPDHIDQLLALTDEMLALNIKRVHLPAADAYAARAGALIYRGDIAGADREIEALGQAQDARRLPEGQWFYERLRVQRKAADGHLQAALEGSARLRAQAEHLGLTYGPWFVDALDRVITLDMHGAKAMLAKIGGNGAGATATAAVQPVNIRARVARGAAELGATAIAREALDAIASEGFASIAAEISYLGTLANLGIVAAVLRDHARAEQLYALLLPYASFNTPNTLLMYEGSVSRFLGHLAACLGRNDRVSEHFDEALEMNERMGARPLVVRTLFEHARWLKQQSSSSAQARGRELAAQAAKLADSLSMQPLAHRARKLFELASA
jgi:DNA-binding winged helix-turn-helix (wHTH) protein/tetratricopeptide (TPR) repeat protein